MDDLRIEIYRTLSTYTDEEIISQMRKTPAMETQLALCEKFEIIREGNKASVYMLTNTGKK